MKTKLFLIGILLLNKVNGQNNITKEDANFIYQATLKKTYNIEIDQNECSIKSIIVTDKKNNSAILSLDNLDNSFSCDNGNVFNVADINFDGYNDFYYTDLIEAGAGSNFFIYSKFYVFDVAQNNFKIDTSLSQLASPEFDFKTKSIQTSAQDGYNSREENIYRYINGELKLFIQKITTFIPENDEYQKVSIYKLNNGELKLISEKNEYIGEDQAKLEAQKLENEMNSIFKNEVQIEQLTEKQNETENTEPEQIFVSCEVMPKFPGGEAKMFEYLGKNIKYPAYENENKISGTVYVYYVIDTMGKVKNAKIARAVKDAPGLSEEALRVINEMPTWSVGTQNGKPVSVQFTLPIKFIPR